MCPRSGKRWLLKTGIEGLQLTTRDTSIDYDELMAHRITTMREENVTYSGIREVISTIDPLPGAGRIPGVGEARISGGRFCRIRFYEFGMPLMAKLGDPFLLCVIGSRWKTDRIVGYQLRQPDPKNRSGVSGSKA